MKKLFIAFFTRIVAPVDFTENLRQALEWVLAHVWTTYPGLLVDAFACATLGAFYALDRAVGTLLFSAIVYAAPMILLLGPVHGLIFCIGMLGGYLAYILVVPDRVEHVSIVLPSGLRVSCSERRITISARAFWYFAIAASLSWILVGKLLSVPEYRVALGGNLTPLIELGLVVLVMKRVSQSGRLDPGAVQRGDFAILLRCFSDDGFAWTARQWDTEPLIGRLSERLHVLVVGRPGTRIPSYGLPTIYLDPSSWLDAVAHLMREARWVIVNAGASSGLEAEIGILANTVSPTRIVLLTPRFRHAWLAFKKIWPAKLAVPAKLPRGARAITFTEGLEAKVLAVTDHLPR